MSTVPSLILTLLVLAFSECKNVSVITELGTIVGKTEEISFNSTSYTVTKFLGVPFAEPPVDTNRFEKPVKKLPLSQVLVADTLQKGCIQNMGMLQYNLTDNFSEDCLYLNIFLPGDHIDVNNKKAVMIWIYGGYFQVGYGYAYDSPQFAAVNDVIYITINYRVAALGFLSTGDDELPGNLGLWDQHMGIQWVHDNIGKFGGDPTRVTIVGQSAGAGSVVHQSLFEGSDGLFARIIAESGSANNVWALDPTPMKSFNEFAEKAGCERNDRSNTIACIRNLPTEDFERISLLDYELKFLPVIDRDFIKLPPTDIMMNKTDEAWKTLQRFGKYDVIFGVNTAEGYFITRDIDAAVKTAGQNPSNGYTIDMFEKYAMPVIFSEMRKEPSDVLKQAILQQYVDWTDPNNGMRMKQNVLDIGSDMFINAGVARTLNAHSDTRASNNSYFYIFDYEFSVYPSGFWKGALHAEELSFALGFPVYFLNTYLQANLPSDAASQLPRADVELAKKVMAYWSNFVKFG